MVGSKPIKPAPSKFRITAGMVSAKEAQELYDFTTELREEVIAWLKKHHPKLAGGVV